MSLGYRPLVYMWIAHYGDEAYPQFDADTGRENKYNTLKQSGLTKFGFYPFSEQMAIKIWNMEQIIVIPTDNPVYEINLSPLDILYVRRTNHINIRTGERRIIYNLGLNGERLLQIREDGGLEN